MSTFNKDSIKKLMAEGDELHDLREKVAKSTENMEYLLNLLQPAAEVIEKSKVIHEVFNGDEALAAICEASQAQHSFITSKLTVTDLTNIYTAYVKLREECKKDWNKV